MKARIMAAICAVCITAPARADTPEPGADATPRAADAPAPPPVAEEAPFKHWFIRAGPAEVIYDEGAKISVGGQQVPGASVRVKNNFTGEIEGGYYFNPNVSVSLTVGAPPTATLYGTGPLAGLKLGKVTYGPAVAAVQYHITNFGKHFQPYLGSGINYTIVLKNHDAAVQNLKVKSPVGVVLQGGIESWLSKRLSLFVDAKQIFLNTTARGTVAGAPARANIRINPLIVTGGLSFHF